MHLPLRRALLSFPSLLAGALVLGMTFEARGDGSGGSAGSSGAGSSGASGAGSGGSGSGDGDKDKKPATCEDACDAAAGKCLDLCEANNVDKPLPRIKCKLGCSDIRRACVAKCGKK